MKYQYISILIMSFLIVSIFLTCDFLSVKNPNNENPDFFFGVDVAYSEVDEIKELIDEVDQYTNLFLIGSTGISHNITILGEICQYLHEKDLYFIVYDENPFRLNSLKEIQSQLKDRFLGLEYEDENGGLQLDLCPYRAVLEASNYSDAANQFVDRINAYLSRQFRELNSKPSDFYLFTADYGLYWFDYKAGYDVVFAEFGWNYSRQLNVALCRGAATIQNKEWGVMITWTYDQPPYIESGLELYNDLILAYENGAKYIIVFDSNEEYTEGILEREHLEALKQFWKYTKANPRRNNQKSDRVAYVLPKDYGYGFRGPQDKIWGLWEADALSFGITKNLAELLEQHNIRLDIIYDDELELNGIYSKYIFWNGTAFTT